VNEVRRIRELPTVSRGPAAVDVDEVTSYFRTDPSAPALRPVQAWMLDEFNRTGGLVANVAVGYGKSLVGLLSPHLIDADTVAYVLPTSTVSSLVAEANKWKGAYDIWTDIELITYTQLSRRQTRDVLYEKQPDYMILDEAHKLRNTGSARTDRFLKYMDAFPNTRLMVMSGTLMSRSIKDFAHLFHHALKSYTPLPTERVALDTLAKITDDLPDHQYAEQWHWRKYKQFVEAFTDLSGETYMDQKTTHRRETARNALHTRIASSAGVVMTSGSSCSASIRMRPESMDLPASIEDALKDVRRAYLLPNGDVIDAATDAAATERRLSLGFYYRWDWPQGERDTEWLYARRGWNQAVRRTCRYGPDRLDSPAIVRDAVQSGEYSKSSIVEAWERWDDQRHKPEPDTVAEWVDDSVLVHIVEKALDQYEAPLIWYPWQAVVEKLNEHFGGEMVICRPDGQNPEKLDGTRPTAVSQHAHRKGLNLQEAFHENVILSPSPSGQIWEQLMGRTHRGGQPEDTVYFSAMAHVDRHRQALADAYSNAEAIEQTQGQQMKLLQADWTEALWRN